MSDIEDFILDRGTENKPWTKCYCTYSRVEWIDKEKNEWLIFANLFFSAKSKRNFQKIFSGGDTGAREVCVVPDGLRVHRQGHHQVIEKPHCAVILYSRKL